MTPSQYSYDGVTMSGMASQITSLTIVYSTVYPGADQRKYQSPASLAIVRGIHRGPVNSPHKWPATRKLFPFDDVIMSYACRQSSLTPYGVYICKRSYEPKTPFTNYRQISNISRTKSEILNVSCLVSRLSLSNPLKPRSKSRMKM